MQLESVNEIFTATLNSTVASVVYFFPRFLTGLIVLLIGLIVASVVKQVLLQVFKVVKLDQLLAITNAIFPVFSRYQESSS